MENEFVLLLDKVKNVHALGSGIADDDAVPGIGHHTVRPNQAVEHGRASHDIDQLVPEAALQFDFAFGGKAALIYQFASSLKIELRHGNWTLGLLFGPRGQRRG